MSDPNGANTAASTPNSTHDSTPAGAISTSTTKAPKDKSCPFCHTPYTASSLGRHLDTYIRPKNPKPPDGIHDVEKIKKLREGITRRNMRQSSSKRMSSISVSRTVSGENARPTASVNGDVDDDMEDDDDGSRSPPSSAPAQRLNGTETGEPLRWRINEPDFTATGVINNLPPRSASAMSDARRDVSKHQLLKADWDTRQKLSDDRDAAKAAELALKEVLSRVVEATARSANAGLFDFDPLELNFPALCLRILPPPPTLHSPTPFPTNESYSFGPPGAKQWEALQRIVKEKIFAHQRAVSGLQMTASSPLLTPPPFDVDLNRLRDHLNYAYNHWQSYSDQQRHEQWQMEILRSFSKADERGKDLQNQLDEAVRQNEQLKRELESIRCGEPEVSRPALSVSPKSLQEIWKQGYDARHWDYDSLIEKWKGAMREQRKSANGMAAQRPLSATPTVKVNNKKVNPNKQFSNARDEAMDLAAGPVGRAHVPQSHFSEPRYGSTHINLQHPNRVNHSEPEIIEMDGPSPSHSQHHAVQHKQLPPQPQHSPRPLSPLVNAHLSAQSSVRDQRRHSAQLSPHAMPSQQRRVSVQHEHQLSPQPQAHRHNMAIENSSEAAARMMQYTEAPLLQIAQAPSAQSVPVQSPFNAQSLQQPPMQDWMHSQQQAQHQQQFQEAQHAQNMQQQAQQQAQQQQQMQEAQHAQHMQQQQQQQQQQQHMSQEAQHMQPMASVSLAQQPQFPQDHMGEAQYQNMALQVPARPDRRNSHPMIDPGQHVDMQGTPIEAPPSAGPFINARMQVGLEGMTMGFVGPGMGMVGGGGGRV